MRTYTNNPAGDLDPAVHPRESLGMIHKYIQDAAGIRRCCLECGRVEQLAYGGWKESEPMPDKWYGNRTVMEVWHRYFWP